MTDTTNEIMCKCGHGLSDHTKIGTSGCYYWDDHLGYTCDCEVTGLELQAARLSALQTEVEGRGETIRQLREALKLFVVDVNDIPHGWHAEFFNAKDVFAATAPVEGGDTNEEGEK